MVEGVVLPTTAKEWKKDLQTAFSTLTMSHKHTQKKAKDPTTVGEKSTKGGH